MQHKLQILIQGFLIIVLLLTQRWLNHQFEAATFAAAESRAAVTADGVINGLNILMLTGAIGDTQTRELLVKKMGDSTGIKELRVIRGEPVAKQFGPGLAQEVAQDEMDRAVLARGTPAYLQLQYKDGQPALRGVIPFIAQKEFRGTNCLTCHLVAEGSVMGAASVVIDMKDDLAAIRRINLLLWVGQAALQLILFVVVGLLVKTILAPAKNLQVAMAAMQRDGDLTRRLTIASHDEIGQTALAFNSLVDRLQASIRQVKASATQVSASSLELALAADSVADSSEKQSESAKAAAAAAEEVTVSITSVAAVATEVYQISSASLERTDTGVRSLGGLTAEIGQLGSSMTAIETSVSEFLRDTRSITHMTKQVRDIADQTNLLALNAAIEAARAGENGRGFAVVADEVRKLAEKSSHAATEIDTVTRALEAKSETVTSAIERSAEALHSSQELMQSVAGVLSEAGHSVAQTNRGVDAISVSVREQQTAGAAISGNVEEIAQMTERNNHAIQDVSGAAQHLKQLANELENSVSQFKV